MMGGNCDGGSVVGKTFEREMWGDCRDCPSWEQRECEIVCAVLDGREALHECPALTEFVRFEGIKLYGVNKPPERRSSLKFRPG